jgi:predicted unusual protein kinase regulating ubiquinone biosynthesis (AarF/ABC1/UbiB family)
MSSLSTTEAAELEEVPESFKDNQDFQDLLLQVEMEAEMAVQEMVDETCQVETETGMPVDDLCVNEVARVGFRKRLKNVIKATLELVRGIEDEDLVDLSQGEVLERGWEKRATSSALRRNGEVWKVALQCVFQVLKSRKLKVKGASQEEIDAAQVAAAEFIRDSLLKLGPSFIKLGQVISTRTDVLPSTYTDVLKTLTDEVPGFSGERAKQIVSQELGRPCDEVFSNFSPEPLKAASLGQVHSAYYKGQKVAIKVQRAGLKELFDIDLKNLRKLAVLLDKFDPKTDGADRDWVSIYEESERLLYLEIDYLNEADNTDRFARDFADVDWVRVPRVYREVSTPRLLTMEFVDSFKLTDIQRIQQLGLDRSLLSKRVADAFLKQIVETGYFHCDPHPGKNGSVLALCHRSLAMWLTGSRPCALRVRAGNLACDIDGNLVYYDFGMMDELKPNVRKGFRTFCTALFAGGPMISEMQLAKNAKELVNGVEQAGVLAKGADRLAVEKLARFFMRAFKDKQLGKTSGNIKETVGTDLLTLTENNVFRFPSTFTFIFRAFASIEGIGKELDSDFDIGKLAQPFIEKFTDSQKGYKSETEKNLSIFTKATGLNKNDIETAVMQPRKVAYIEETLRAMENGSLKIRVRSLENEKALERLGLRQSIMENVLFASLLFNVAALASRSVVQGLGVAGGVFFLLQSLLASAKIKKFDKTQSKYASTEFVDAAAVVDDD